VTVSGQAHAAQLSELEAKKCWAQWLTRGISRRGAGKRRQSHPMRSGLWHAPEPSERRIVWLSSSSRRMRECLASKPSPSLRSLAA
jgi:hypothetical protein